MTELCWKEKFNGKYCKNYRLDNKSRCRHHVVDNFNKTFYILFILNFTFILTFFYYQYTLNEYEVNKYIFITINNICKNLENIEKYRKFYQNEQFTKYYLKNLQIYIETFFNKLKNANCYLNEYFKMYDNFIFNYTMKNIHDFILKNILNKN